MTLQRQTPSGHRLDSLLVEQGHYPTRSRARDAIARSAVSVDGKTAQKAGQLVVADAHIVIDDDARFYVSRAALKLIAGLDAFALGPRGCHALDIGASTGGFTQVLLERGAASVHAIDVGHGQMAYEVANDPRVVKLEGLNARLLTADHFGGFAPDFIVSDVSFISLKLALPPALELARPGAHALLLVKPQFEAGREAIGKGGLLKHPQDAEEVARQLHDWLDNQPGWNATGLIPSPIPGGDGNREFLLAGRKNG